MPDLNDFYIGSLFHVTPDITDLYSQTVGWTDQTFENMKQWSRNLPPEQVARGGMAIGGVLAAGGAKVLSGNPLNQIIAGIAGGVLGHNLPHILPKDWTRPTTDSRQLPDTQIVQSTPNGKTVLNNLGLPPTIVEEIEQEFSDCLTVISNSENNSRIPKMVTRTISVLLEDLLRTFLFDQMKTEIRATLRPYIKPTDKYSLALIEGQQRISLGSLARWCELIEGCIEKNLDIAQFYIQLLGSPEIFIGAKENRLSTLLQRLAPIRNTLMHKTTGGNTSHQQMISLCFHTSQLEQWWNEPINCESPINHMLFHRYDIWTDTNRHP